MITCSILQIILKNISAIPPSAKLFAPLNEGIVDRAMKATLYTLRHSSATIILNNTGNQRLVQAVLNHAGGEMTARYAKILDSSKAIGINSL